MTISELSVHRPYYNKTTIQQRQTMIQVYEQTNNVSFACKMAGVSRGTFYRWHPRYKQKGEDGIRITPPRQGWHDPKTTIEATGKLVIELKKEYPYMGKLSIAIDFHILNFKKLG